MTRRLLRIPLVMVLVVILYCGVAVAGGWQYSGIGARAEAMGTAYRAISDDWSGAYYNPAGLAFVESSIFNLSAVTISPRPEIESDFTMEGYGLGYLDGETRYPDDKILLWGAASVFVKPSEEGPLVFGMSVYQPYDHNAKFNLYYLRDEYSDRGSIPKENHNSNFDVIAFHPAVALKFSEDRFSVGIGVPIYRGDIELQQIRLVDNPYDYVLDVRPYENFPKLYSVDGYGYGIGFNIGLQFRPNEQLSFGASYTSSATISLDGDSREEVFLPHNAGIVNLYNDPKAPDNEDEIRVTYSGGSFFADSEFDFDLKLPSEFGFGVAYQASEKVLLAADLAYTLWSEFDDLEFMISNRQIDRSVNSTWQSMFGDLYVPTEWDDVVKISLGIEGVLSERWILRGGYMYDQSPVPDETFSPIFLDTGDKHRFSAGANFALSETISFDGMLAATLYGERTIDNIVDINNDGYFDNYGGTFKNTAFSSTWAINYRF